MGIEVGEKIDYLEPTVKPVANHIFIFLEVFGCEGGIQSYVKDILQSYTSLGNQAKGEVFLLRDSVGCPNPFEGKNLKFHYLKSQNPQKGRLRLATSLLACLLQRRPHHVF